MEMIGHYEVRELLGEGGIGQVHAGFDTTLEREVAIKSLRPELLNDKNFVDRFRAEATSLARLNHPNITTLYSLLPEGRNLYMIMELVRGDTLDALLKKRNGPFGIRESLAIVAQAADGLGYAHSMGIIHRDIKPANLMITESGLLKIMDFGIARVRGSQRLTRDGSMVGTLAYMAPEQLRGDSGDERSDLYSLAIVLYEMLSGSTPFEAESDYDLMQAHIHAKPQRLVARVPGLDPRIDAALLRALAKTPAQRFASVREFCDALGATALRVDASKIVYEGTRVLARPPDLAGASGSSGSFTRMSATVDRFSPGWLPRQLRVPIVVGASTLVAAGAIVMGTLALMPSPVAEVPTRSMQIATAPSKDPAPALPPAGVPPTPPPGPSAAAVPPPSAAPAPRSTGVPSPAPAGADAPPAPAQGDGADATPAAPPPDPFTAVPGPTAKLDFKAALDRKDFDEAFRIAAPLAAGGDRDAQYAVGSFYDRGLGVERDLEKAAIWYRKAADQGQRSAQVNLATMYEYGSGVAQSDEEAFSWYRKAGDQDDAEAQNRIGVYYAQGQATPKDDTAAVLWYVKAAKQGYAKALKNLGDMYATGRGVRRDEREALRLYYQAAEQKLASAEFNVGYWHETGRGGLRRNYRTAAEWYRRAAEHGSVPAQDQLDLLRNRGRIDD
jgi:serine/threonine protein kinase/TPR repeat protein